MPLEFSQSKYSPTKLKFRTVSIQSLSEHCSETLSSLSSISSVDNLLLVSCLLQSVIFATSSDSKKSESVGPIGYELLESRLESLEIMILQLSKHLGSKMDQILKIHESKETQLSVSETEKRISSEQNLEDPCKAANQSGVYQLQLHGKTPINVLCESKDFDGGWLVIQQRLDGSENFDRSWTDYRSGFGTVGNRTEFWVGLEWIHQLVSKADYELVVELKNDRGKYGYAKFSNFKVAGEEEKYKLIDVGMYHGTIGDMMSYGIGKAFSTSDRDNDIWGNGNCAETYAGGWWFGHCAYSFLNGPYFRDRTTVNGITWAQWTTEASYSRMMIRRKASVV